LRQQDHIRPMALNTPPSRPQTSQRGTTVAHVFDRHRVRANRNRAATRYEDFAFVKSAAVDDLLDRLEAVNRTFGLALDLGSHTGGFARAFQRRPTLSGKIGELVQTDLSGAMLALAEGMRVQADEERLPFADGSFDLVVSALSLHWVNDLPGALIQARHALKSDGLFLATLLGGRTLQEVRACLYEAEVELTGGAVPRVSPFADAPDIAALLQRAGFALPVTDSHVLTVRYGSVLRLFEDLKGMGERAAFADRARPTLSRAVFGRAMALYQGRHADAEGRVAASFDLITATGWTPHESQQKPLAPGSAKTRLADALGVTEQSLDEKATPGRRPGR
jgi:SAM-dependent methyltransferase